MRNSTKTQDKNTVIAVAFAMVLALVGASMLGGCAMHVRLLTDSQLKTERMGRLIWNGSDAGNSLRGATALEKWRRANNSPLAGTSK